MNVQREVVATLTVYNDEHVLTLVVHPLKQTYYF